MKSLDELFQIFIQELEIKSVPQKTVNGYIHCYQCFSKLMPEITIDSINDELILIFINKLRKTKFWNHNTQEFVSLKSTLILNFMNYLWSFFIWLKKYRKNELNRIIDTTHGKNEFVILLKFISEYRDNCDYLFDTSNMEDNPNNHFNAELLIKQLNRRFNSFFNLSDAVYFRAVAEYIKFISRKKQLAEIVKTEILEKERVSLLEIQSLKDGDLEYSEYLYQNSEWGSWFNLELVYLLIYKIRDLLDKFTDNPDFIIFLKKRYCELFGILRDCEISKKTYFKRNVYNLDVIRVHNFLLEVLEKSIEQPKILKEPEQSVIYKYNEYGVPYGELKILGYESIFFVKNPAVAVQYFYLNRERKEYFSYHGFNEFRGPTNKHITSNIFRLLIDGINKRVCSLTSNMVKSLIIKKKKNMFGKETNYYKFNIKI
jgi:hypothetical protein